MNKKDLVAKLKQLEGLTPDERAELINLLNTQKKYGLVWEDKPEDVEEQLRTQLPVLREVVEKRIIAKPSLNQDDKEWKDNQDKNPMLEFDTEDKTSNPESLESFNPSNHSSDNGAAPNHILIEGDNLHALTALTFTHEGKIDVIYIDPPYNTGNKDFKYNDAFVDKEDSYRHSKWLSFMLKRLEIAKRLLSDKGVIFISIDDNENAQLKLLCDEIFEERNLISDIIWQSRKSVSNDTFVSLNHNYTLVYAKNQSLLDKNNFRLPTSSEKFENLDNDPRGPWVADPFDAPNLRPNLTYPIYNPNNGKEFWPPKGRCWRTTKEEYDKFYNDNRIVFGKKGETKPQLKRFLDFAQEKGMTPISIWNDIETTTNGTQQLEIILGSKMFTNPKPIGLLDRILKLSSDNKKAYTILDFFAGSGTTLHATMQLNAEDGGNRQCILVTNNENNICEEVTYERNKRVIKGYTNAKGVQVEGLTNNNLRYYRSEYVGREKTHKNKRELVLAATELLCIKEDIYTELAELNGHKLDKKTIRCFSDKGRYLMVIYDEETIETLLPLISAIDTHHKIKIYIFAPGQYPFTEEFEDVLDKVELCALPDAIYKAYANVLPKKKAKPTVMDSEEERTETETSESAEPNLFTV